MSYLAIIKVIKKFWRESIMIMLCVLLVSSLVGGYFVYKHQNYKLINQQASHDLVIAEFNHQILKLEKDYLAKAREIESKNYEGVINAINESAERQKQINLDIESVNDAVNELHSITNTIDTSLAKASRSAAIDYTKSVSGLFESCTSRYFEMAENAAREQEEARRLRQAWPRN